MIQRAYVVSRNIIISLALCFIFLALLFPSGASALTTRLFNNFYYDVANVDNYLYLKIHGSDTFTYVLKNPVMTDILEDSSHLRLSTAVDRILSITNNSSSSSQQTSVSQTFITNKRKITRQLICEKKSPFVTLNYEVRYLVDTNSQEEFFDITFKSLKNSILTRDYRIQSPIASQKYFVDPLTPLYMKECNSTMASMKTGNSYMLTNLWGINLRALRVYIQDFRYITTFYFNEFKRKVFIKHQRVSEGDTKQLSLRINANEVRKPIFPFRSPGGTEAIFIFNDHPDSSTAKSNEAMLYGRSSSSSFGPVTSGFVGRGLKATWGVFYKSWGTSTEGLDKPECRTLLSKMVSAGFEIAPHTASPSPTENSRSFVAEMLEYLNQYKLSSWIDHSLSSGVTCAAVMSRGWDTQSPFYMLDLLKNNGYKYVWSYTDVPVEGINMLCPTQTWRYTPVLFKNDVIRDQSGYSFYYWNTWRARIKELLNHMTSNNLDSLISQKGVSINHEYFGHSYQNGYMFTTDAYGVYRIAPQIDDVLGMISDRQAQGLLWVPTVRQFGDYIQKLLKVKVKETTGGYELENGNQEEIPGFTVLVPTSSRFNLYVDGVKAQKHLDVSAANTLCTLTLKPGIKVKISYLGGSPPRLISGRISVGQMPPGTKDYVVGLSGSAISSSYVRAASPYVPHNVIGYSAVRSDGSFGKIPIGSNRFPRVYVYAVDANGNRSTSIVKYNDIARPRMAALSVLRPSTLKAGGTMKVLFKIYDNSSRARVFIKIYKGTKLIAFLRPGYRLCGVWQYVRFNTGVRWPKGGFVMRIYAKDAAGNPSRVTASMFRLR